MSAETIEREIEPLPVQIVRQQRRYSDADKAKALIALDLNAGNLLKTSQQLQIPIMTLSEWRNGTVTNDVTKTRIAKRETLADLCETAAHEFVAQARSTIEHSKGTQAATGAAIFIDKMRLLRGEPTIITQQIEPVANTINTILQTMFTLANTGIQPFPTQTELNETIEAFAESNNVDVKQLMPLIEMPQGMDET